MNKLTAPSPVPAGAELVDMEEAIACLKTTRATFYRWLRAGKLKGMKVGRRWRFYRHDLEHFLKGGEPQIELTADIGPLLALLDERLTACGHGDALPPLAAAAGPEAKLLAAVERLLAAAFWMRASDIHLRPRQTRGAAPGARLQFRIDGVLQDIAAIDIRLLAPLVERLKAMAACDRHERTRPQDGRLELTLNGRSLDLRLCFLPTVLGEAVTVRLLDAGGVIVDLDRIPFSTVDRQRVDRALQSGYGMILFTGPTSSGKTSTQYAAMSVLTRKGMRVISVEDPVEYLLEDMVQVQVNAVVGMTFPAGLRAVLRSDPDAIMVTEIRDHETLQILLQAALMGHLVVGSLHAEDAVGALLRLCDIGAAPFSVADALRLVVSQRLVRRLCPDCSRPRTPAPDELAKAAALARQGGLDWDSLPRTFREPVGCSKCSMTGYRGRTMIAETLEVTPEMAKVIRLGAKAEDLRRLAIEQGMTSIAADGMRRYAAGQTALTEVLRVLGNN